MTWEVLKVHPSPLQTSVTLINRDAAATVTTDYRAADKLARATIGACSLAGKSESFDRPKRVYVSQAY